MTATESLHASNLLEQINDLYDKGLYLKAYEISKQAGPIKQWKGAKSMILGGRLAGNLGSSRVARAMFRMAEREYPDDPQVRYFYTYAMLGRRSPYQTVERMEKIGDLNTDDPIVQTDWYALRSLVLSVMRDFERADYWIDRAIEQQPDRPWLYVQRAYTLGSQDRIDDAIKMSEHALTLQPWYRPALQELAYRLVQSNQDEKALSLMRTGITKIESGDLRMQLASLCMELENFEEASELYASVEKYFPILMEDPKVEPALAQLRADMAYYLGNKTEALSQGKKAKSSEFFDGFMERLGDEKFAGKRKRLPVAFVRQNHMTCAPATLTTISRFFDVEAEHLDIVEEICYDGTPAHSERRWAEKSGFVTREFRLTWDVTRQLIDRDVPFTLTTVDPGNAHLQAIIGYDSYRDTILIRDPGDRHSSEFVATKMLEHYASSGPRAMVFVPEDKKHLLDGIELPDAEMYDLYYLVQTALEAHKREEAKAVVDQMVAKDSDHRLTLHARANVARYDRDLGELKMIYDKLLEQYPKDVNVQIVRLSCMSDLGRREDRIQTLRECVGDVEKDNALYWMQLASELSSDARERDYVESLLRKCLKYRSHDGAAYSLLGGQYFDQQREKEGTDLFRIAACLEERNEERAKSYFYASRALNDVATPMRFLEDRRKRFGSKSSLPSRTMCWAYDQLEKSKSAMKVLNEAYKQHPKDGDLLLYMAEYSGRRGKFETAEKLLKKAKPLAHRAVWTRIAGLIASYQGENAEALEHWKTLVEIDPLDTLAHSYVAGLVADEGGPAAAISHLEKYVQQFPNCYPLSTMLLEWKSNEGQPEQYRKDLEDFLVQHPDDAWALRELAINHLKTREFEAATKAIEASEVIDPSAPIADFLRGRMCMLQNQNDEAVKFFRKSLTKNIDYDHAFGSLFMCCDAKADRERELKFIKSELDRQVGLGDGYMAYYSYARECLDPAELLKSLNETLEKDKDRWQSWAVVVRQLSNMQRHDEAIKIASKGAKRFPLLPRMWLELASANRACGKVDEEIVALRKAKEINPTWSQPVHLLSEALEKKGDLAGARKELETLLRAEPRDVGTLGALAANLWDQDEKEKAVELVARAVRIQPGYEWGWSALRHWCAAVGKPDYDVEVARELTEKRPHETRSWLMLALALDQPEQFEDALAALDKAIEFNPHSIECFSQKAVLLSRAGMYDEALQTARPAVFGNEQPLELVGRAAWIEGERGNFAVAISQMEQVVQADPDYFWAWENLAAWYRYTEQAEKYQGAAREMIRVQPQNAISWGYMGEAELRNDNKEVAKEHFRQAVQLSPSYGYASDRLLDMLVEEKEFEEAKAIVEYIAPHSGPEWYVANQGRIAAASGDKETAFEMLRHTFTMDTEDNSAIDSLVESMYGAEWRDETLSVLDAELNRAECKPGVAYVYVHLSTSLGKWDLCEKRLESLRDRLELWNVGSSKFIEESGHDPEHHGRLKKFITKYEQRLRADTRMWEAVGSALCQADLDEDTCMWMKDWSKFNDLTCWGLYAFICSAWEQKWEHKAHEAQEYAIKKLEPDHALGYHLVYESLYQIIYGSPQNAAEYIRDVDPMGLNPFAHLSYEFVTTVLQNLHQGGSYSELNKALDLCYNRADSSVRQSGMMTRIHKLVKWSAARVHGKKVQGFVKKLAANWS